MSDLIQLLNEREFLIVAIFLLGLCVGSFLNVVIYRLPLILNRQWREQAIELLTEQGTPVEVPAIYGNETFNLVKPDSRCPHCQSPIRAWQNIPVFSYLFLRGRCAQCSAQISVRYPLVELFTGLVFALAAWQFGLDFLLFGTLLFSALLIAMTGIDLDHKLLPDQLTYVLLWSGLLFNLVDGFTPINDAVIGAVAGYLFLWLVYWAFKLTTGKEGMGYGDFKLLAALGAWLGWQQLPLIIIVSAASGLIIGGGAMLLSRDKSPQIPFGPHLAIAGGVGLYFGPNLIDRYWQFMGS